MYKVFKYIKSGRWGCVVEGWGIWLIEVSTCNMSSVQHIIRTQDVGNIFGNIYIYIYIYEEIILKLKPGFQFKLFSSTEFCKLQKNNIFRALNFTKNSRHISIQNQMFHFLSRYAPWLPTGRMKRVSLIFFFFTTNDVRRSNIYCDILRPYNGEG